MSVISCPPLPDFEGQHSRFLHHHFLNLRLCNQFLRYPILARVTQPSALRVESGVSINGRGREAIQAGGTRMIGIGSEIGSGGDGRGGGGGGGGDDNHSGSSGKKVRGGRRRRGG